MMLYKNVARQNINLDHKQVGLIHSQVPVHFCVSLNTNIMSLGGTQYAKQRDLSCSKKISLANHQAQEPERIHTHHKISTNSLRIA